MRKLSLLLSTLLLSALAHGASGANIGTVSCAGEQSFSLTDTAAFACSGDLSLSGGDITSDSRISITAYGSLFLGDLTLRAPTIELKSFAGTIAIGDGVRLLFSTASNIGTGGTASLDVSRSPGATLTWIGGDDLTRPIAGRAIPLLGGGQITLSKGGDLSLTAIGGEDLTRTVTGGDIELSGGSRITLSEGGTVSLISTVPEPSVALSMFAGLLLLAIRSGRWGGAWAGGSQAG